MIIGKKSVMIAMVLATIGAGALSVGTTFAAEKVTPKFHLNVADARIMFHTRHAMNTVERKQNVFDHLAKAVVNGKITQALSTALQAKMEAEKAFTASLKTMTPEHRKTAVKTERASLEQWAKDNGIPKGIARFLPLIGPMEHQMHMRHDRIGNRVEVKK